ncbi:MAG: hypothetical protein GXY34_00455 [Syntrophomonadaceae bacterium]|nr:hypothetical protein [Syntrophomonadaceae bacterium]
MIDLDQVLVDPKKNYIAALTPVTVVALMKFRPDRFRYEDCLPYLASHGLEVSDFYFNRFEAFAWYVYYKDFVMLDLPAFNVRTLESFQPARAYEFEKSRLQACLDAEDYLSFFTLVHKRLALKVYLELFSRIPDPEKAEVFWYIFSRCDYRLEDFEPAFIARIKQFTPDGSPLRCQPTGESRDIYRGQAADGQENPAHQPWATSWTLDINAAILHATRLLTSGRIFSGKIACEKVVALIKYRNENEIIAYPDDIFDIHEIPQLSYYDLEPELQAAGILTLDAAYQQRLKPGYFHRPFGIHGLAHTKRVLLHCLILSYLEQISPASTDILCNAALYHDIGRTNDNYDPQHGCESYKKLLALQLSPYEDIDSSETLRFLMENHCVADQEAVNLLTGYQVQDPGYVLDLYHVFKDADGLDRIRIMDLDVKQLRTESARRLLLVARQLYQTITA